MTNDQIGPSLLAALARVPAMRPHHGRAIREAHPELYEWLWGNSFWADGYFAESVGRVTEKAVEQYIENQKDRPSMAKQGSLGLKSEEGSLCSQVGRTGFELTNRSAPNPPA
jgi:hypothetical protein